MIPLPPLIPDAPELFKASLKVVVAEERALDGPEDLTGKTTAQIGLYSHLCQDSLTSGDRPGANFLPTPAPFATVVL